MEPICFFTVYSSRYQYISLVKEHVVWISKESKKNLATKVEDRGKHIISFVVPMSELKIVDSIYFHLFSHFYFIFYFYFLFLNLGLGVSVSVI